jgi:23S rRNA (guanosine2251-2'-O)-methyltransferase
MEHLEGRQSVLAALRAYQRRFQVILIRHDGHREKLTDLIELAEQRNVPIRLVEAAELDALAHGATHGGIVAICTPKPRLTPPELLELVDALREPPLLLLLEGVDDARNLGFTLRSADALGVHAVLIKKHLWDFDPVEVARPASGAYERLPLVQIEDVDVLRQLQRRGVQLVGCLAGAKRSLYETDLTTPVLLAIGGEKRGLSGAVRASCDTFVTIPMHGQTSSLSLSHAASIVMAEAMRQRQPRSDPSTPPDTGHACREQI